MTEPKTFRCHDADACALGQLPCPTPAACGCSAPCPVNDGTHQPAEALHQIAEPALQSLRERLQITRANLGHGNHWVEVRATVVEEAIALHDRQAARIAELEKAESNLIAQRDHCEEVIDRMADAVLGKDRHEWTSAYDYMDAAEEVEDRMAEMEAENVHKDSERRAAVAEALGLGNANFAWSYLHGQIKDLVKCEEELIALRKQGANAQDKVEAQHREELRAYEITVANRDARIAELEAQLEAIGAGGVEPLRKHASRVVPKAVQIEPRAHPATVEINWSAFGQERPDINVNGWHIDGKNLVKCANTGVLIGLANMLLDEAEHQGHSFAATQPAALGMAEDAEVPEAVLDAVAAALGDAYDCGRVWSAWGVGTMSSDDFTLVSEDGERVAEIARAALAAQAKQGG